MSMLRQPLWTTALPLLLATGAQAQSDAALETEIEFARGLASEWAFVDLAEVVLDSAERGASGKTAERLSVTRCELIAAGARNERDAARRNELFESALACFDGYIAGNANSELLSTAQTGFVDASALYARAIELALEDAAGEEADALRERQAEVLSKAVSLTQDLIDSLAAMDSETRGERRTREMYELMLNRGSMLATIGRADPTSSFFFDQALQAYENLVFTAGEGTLYALRAFSGMGDVYAYRLEWEDAAAFYAAVVETTLPSFEGEWDAIKEDLGLGAADIEVRFALMEIAIPGLLKAFVNAGDNDEAVRYALHFMNTQREEGVNTSPQGYLAMLEIARTFLTVGGWVAGDFSSGEAGWYPDEETARDAVRNRRLRQDATSLAMELATQTADENKNNTLQTMAQKLISEIAARPGVTISPELQVAAAEGEFRSGNTAEAIQQLRGLLSTLDAADEDVRLELAPKVLNLLGLAYRSQDRPLESAFAFREAVARYRGGDPELDRRNAESYYAMVRQVTNAAAAERAPLEKLQAEAERWVTEAGSEKEDEILWRRGEKAYDKKDWAGAVEAYNGIPEDSDYWEKGYVKVGVCMVRQKQYAPAIDRFDEYLDTIRDDPARATDVPARLARRKEASLEAEFFRGLSHSILKNHDKVVELLPTYHERYPEQGQLSNWTLDLLMRSYLALDRRQEARGALDTMLELFGEEKRTGAASISFYNALTKLQDEATDAERKATILREMAELLAHTNGMGAPDYTAIKRESMHWMDLAEWGQAETVLRRLVETFSSDSERAEEIATYRLPDLAHALVMQKKVVDAKEILTPLVMTEDSNPTLQMLLDWSMSLSGWLETNPEDGRLVVVPGATGTAEEYEFAATKLNALSNSRRYVKYQDCEWYEVKFRFCFVYYAWSQLDSRKAPELENQMNSIAVGTDNDWANITPYCAEDEDPDVVARYAGGQLATWFQWLASR